MSLQSCFVSIIGRKLSDGKPLGGRGRLTLSKCDAMQNFYGRAIRDNKGIRTIYNTNLARDGCLCFIIFYTSERINFCCNRKICRRHYSK